MRGNRGKLEPIVELIDCVYPGHRPIAESDANAKFDAFSVSLNLDKILINRTEQTKQAHHSTHSTHHTPPTTLHPLHSTPLHSTHPPTFFCVTQFVNTMRESGLVEEEQLEEWEKNPKKMIKDIKNQAREMDKMMSSPEMMQQIKETTESIVEMMSNPEKMEAAFNEIVRELEEWDTDLAGAEKIEEARRMLLDGTLDTANTPALKSIFQDTEMQKMLNDRKKFQNEIAKKQGNRRGGVADSL